MACRLFTVSGKVQGVFFRASTQTQALALGIQGHAMNLPDGQVQVLACGDAEALDQLARWLQQGPEHAVVKRVEQRIVRPDQRPSRFTTG